MSIDAVDVVVVSDLAAPSVGELFPPSDGAFVSVDTGSEWLRGWVVVDRDVAPAPECGVAVAVVPVAAGVPVWQGHVTADQVKLEAPGVQPVWWDRMAPVVASSLAARRSEARAKEAQGVAEGRARALEAEHRQWVDGLVADACAWADENSLCEQFDRFMEAHDLPGRSRDFDVEVEVVVRAVVTVPVSARSADDARESVCSDEVDSAMREKIACSGFDIDDWSVESVDER